MKRMSQPLEVRRLVDRVLDGDPEAYIVVAGAFHAASHEVPVLIIDDKYLESDRASVVATFRFG
jgi:hypothetical protein